MTVIKVTVTGNSLTAIADGKLTSGTVGQPVQFSFDESWTGFEKTAVFRAGDVAKDVLYIHDSAAVPWEVMQKKNCILQVGIYGTAPDGKQTPTIWADVDRIQPGADPAGDESADPSLPVWAQVTQKLDAAVLDLERHRDAGEFDGADGLTPYIGGNGNWWIGDQDTGQPSHGNNGEPFRIAATYSNFEELYAAWELGEIADGEYVVVSTKNPNDSENGNLYRGDGNGPQFVVKMSGRTPVAGVDYYTQAEKEQLVQDVLDALPDGDEVRY